jgi:hypothetical protein
MDSVNMNSVTGIVAFTKGNQIPIYSKPNVRIVGFMTLSIIGIQLFYTHWEVS